MLWIEALDLLNARASVLGEVEDIDLTDETVGIGLEAELSSAGASRFVI